MSIAISPNNLTAEVQLKSLDESGKAQSSTINLTSDTPTEETVKINGLTQQQVQEETKRNRQQLLDSLKFLQAHGMTQEEGIEILCAMNMGCSEEVLLNLDQNVLNKHLQTLTDTLKAMKEDGISINLENVKIEAKKYSNLILNKWSSVDEVRDRNKAAGAESFVDKMLRYHKGIKKDTLTNEEYQKAYNEYLNSNNISKDIEKYFVDYYSETIMKDIVETAKKENKSAEWVKSEFVRKQQRDFSRMLSNASEQELDIILEATKHLTDNAKLTGIIATVESFEEKEQSEIASNYALVKELTTHKDIFGNSTEGEVNTKIHSYLASKRTVSDALEYNKESVADIKHFNSQPGREEEISRIKEKINNGEELTNEEKTVLREYQHHLDNATGNFIGYQNNNVMSQDEKALVTTDLNKGLYETPIYRDVMENVVNTINENPEMLSISKEEFTKLLDTATNGNYSIVSKDIENGNTSKSELNAPDVVTIKDIVKEQSKQVTAQDAAAAQERLNKLNEIIKTQQAEIVRNQVENTSKSETVKAVKSVREYIESEGGISRGFQKFREEKGLINAIPLIIESAVGVGLENMAIRAYDILPNNAKKAILEKASGKVIETLAPYTSLEILQKVNQGKSFNETQILENIIKEKEEMLEKQP